MSQKRIPLWGIKRTPDFELISIEDLKKAEYNGYTDEWFLKEYSAYMAGKRTALLTRISADRIIPGFFERSENEWYARKNDIELDILGFFIDRIRNGERSTLDIYPCWNDKSLFCCPDDQYALEAYKALGIELLPVRIFRHSKEQSEESGVTVKCVLQRSGNPTQVIDSFQPRTWEDVETYYNLQHPLSTNEEFEKIVSEISHAIEILSKFHLAKDNGVHYHHCLYSILARMKSMTASIKDLAEKGRLDEATILVRSLYELSLNFYLDWLSPHHMGPYIKAFSLTRRDDWTKPSSSRSRHSDPKELQNHRLREYDLITSIKEKARIFPLGQHYYENSYRTLSDFAHQSFTLVPDYAEIFETMSNGGKKAEESRVNLLTISASSLSAIVITRIKKEIWKSTKDF